MNCIIVDPIRFDSVRLKNFILSVNGLELAAICEDLKQAKQIISEKNIDVVFIDVSSYGNSGIDFIKSLDETLAVFVTTASSDYAINAFELGVKDYLIKPIGFERLEKALTRMPHTFNGFEAVKESSPGYFFVKSDNKFEKINHSDILYIEGLQNYITIRTQTKKIVTYSSLKGILNYLCEKEFLRVQKSFIVSISKIDSINSDDIVIGTTSIPISRSIRDNVLKTILNDRLYKYQC